MRSSLSVSRFESINARCCASSRPLYRRSTERRVRLLARRAASAASPSSALSSWLPKPDFSARLLSDSRSTWRVVLPCSAAARAASPSAPT
eukprot:scaffold24215_cov129-Isochrysis_galbana.AAC.5